MTRLDRQKLLADFKKREDAKEKRLGGLIAILPDQGVICRCIIEGCRYRKIHFGFRRDLNAKGKQRFFDPVHRARIFLTQHFNWMHHAQDGNIKYVSAMMAKSEDRIPI